jgi:predicted choloylglycine hydrolase
MSDPKAVLFRHATFQGTSYEIGRKQAELIQNHYPGEIDFLFNGNQFIRPLSPEKVKAAMGVFDQYCPCLNEEIRGFADYFHKSPEEVIYYSFSNVAKGQCSQFAVLPQRTADGKAYAGRSYEWDAGDNKRLLTVKADGLYAHMGFSLLLFGRYDGMNEKGLYVTMTNGVPLVWSEEEGLRFWAVIRILLDQCASVDEAVEMVKRLPVSSFVCLAVTDRNHQAALIEIANNVKTIKRISPSTDPGFFCSANHYTLPEMQVHVRNRMQHSVDRTQAMMKALESGPVDKAALMKLLSSKMPEGMACHFYNEGLGTLWSVLYDVDEGKADICFGSPLVNPWHSFDLNTPEGIKTYQALLPDEEASPSNWARV